MDHLLHPPRTRRTTFAARRGATRRVACEERGWCVRGACVHAQQVERSWLPADSRWCLYLSAAVWLLMGTNQLHVSSSLLHVYFIPIHPPPLPPPASTSRLRLPHPSPVSTVPECWRIEIWTLYAALGTMLAGRWMGVGSNVPDLVLPCAPLFSPSF